MNCENTDNDILRLNNIIQMIHNNTIPQLNTAEEYKNLVYYFDFFHIKINGMLPKLVNLLYFEFLKLKNQG